jgi:phage terminase small subunit
MSVDGHQEGNKNIFGYGGDKKMGRQRDPKRDRAYEMYRASGGKMELKEIAAALNVPEGTVRAWKKRDSWDNPDVVNVAKESKKNNAMLQKKKRNATNETQRNAKRKKDPDPVLKIEVETEGLTDRQRMFCIYYAKSFNATQSAIKAGYAKESAHVEGSRLLANDKIRAEIKRIKAEIAKPLMIDAMDILNQYAAIAFADITDYVNFGGQKVEFKDAKEVDGSLISEIKAGKREISIKLHDKMKALEKLEKYFDLLPDHHKRRIEEERLKIDQKRLELEEKKAAGEGGADSALVEDWAESVIEQ